MSLAAQRIRRPPSPQLVHPSSYLDRIWLVDLAKQTQSDAQLDGFDISSAHFPPKNELPENVNLAHLDMTQPIPDHLVGQYDIVHIGRIVLYIQNEDPSKLLTNFLSLLSRFARLVLRPWSPCRR